jgi:hypothetical protein
VVSIFGLVYQAFGYKQNFVCSTFLFEIRVFWWLNFAMLGIKRSEMDLYK